MTTYSHDESSSQLSALIDAFDSLPIISRLEFVANILFDKFGSLDSEPVGSGEPRDWNSVLASEVLKGAIRVLRSHPTAAQLRTPELP